MIEQTRLLALARLKVGVKPIVVSEECGISYSQALKLKKDLADAEEKNTMAELVRMDDAAFEVLLDTVRTQLADPAKALGLTEELEGELMSLTEGMTSNKKLEKELVDAAAVLATKIRQMAVLANNSDTVLVLAEALAKLQSSFFAKGTNVQINQTGNNFETFLRD